MLAGALLHSHLSRSLLISFGREEQIDPSSFDFKRGSRKVTVLTLSIDLRSVLWRVRLKPPSSKMPGAIPGPAAFLP